MHEGDHQMQRDRSKRDEKSLPVSSVLDFEDLRRSSGGKIFRWRARLEQDCRRMAGLVIPNQRLIDAKLHEKSTVGRGQAALEKSR